MSQVDDENLHKAEKLLSRYVSLLRLFRTQFKENLRGEWGSSADPTHVSVSEMLQEMKSLSASCPSSVHRRLDWNGKPKAYEESSFSMTDREGNNLLAEWLEVILTLVSSKKAAKQFYQSGLTEWMEELCCFADDHLKGSLTKLYGHLCTFSDALRDDLVDAQNITGICGMIRANSDNCVEKGMEGLLGMVDRLTGDKYMWFQSSPLGLQRVAHIYTTGLSDQKRTAGKIILMCLDRSRRMQTIRSSHLPSAGPWKRLVSHLSDLISPQAAPRIEQNLLPEVKAARSGEADKKEALDPKCHNKTEATVGQYDEDGVRVVFDSGPSKTVKSHRAAWKTQSLNDKIRWTQTTEDILIWITVPKATRVAEISVLVEPQRLCIKLDWFGRVVDGPLHRRCKASESLWVLEDAEIHITLPKDDLHFWKSLFEGGTEKSFMEIIQESVDSDEAVVNYDDMDLRSKELIEEIRERQQMIQEGLIDLEGFDDFRIVVGEQSL